MKYFWLACHAYLASFSAMTTFWGANACDTVLKIGQQCGGRGFCVDPVSRDTFLCHTKDKPWKDSCCDIGATCTQIRSTWTPSYWRCVKSPDNNPSKPRSGTRPNRPSPPSKPSPNTPRKPIPNVLYVHNAYRKHHMVNPVSWDSNIAATARFVASQCVFRHGLQKSYGENLFALSKALQCRIRYDRLALYNERNGTNNIALPLPLLEDRDLASLAAKLWYDEVKYYDWSAPGFSQTTGHFTQLVWADTKYIGCATNVCESMNLVVCLYWPPGNVLGKYKQNVLKPSS